MTTAILAARRGLIDFHRTARELVSWRVLVPLCLASLALFAPAAGRIIVDTIAEAYLQVSVFVAGTLIVLYGIERLFRFDLADTLRSHPGAQVPVAALLGALPGCGGAIVVVTQYVNGHVGFGALIAVLTATMGDAAFLLLSREPATAAIVFALGLSVGTVCGWVVDRIHGRDFMRRQTVAEAGDHPTSGRRPRTSTRLQPVWIALMVPGLVFALPIAAQVDPNAWFGPLAASEPVTWLGFAGGMLSLLMWSAHMTTEPGHVDGAPCTTANPNDRASTPPTLRSRVINDTNFVTVWVIAAFLLFELGVHFTGADLGAWFSGWVVLTPLVAIVIGFLPGCGPQIIVTGLYLTGAIPVAALLGNAISNDGDALFPAIALAPRAAILATLYTALPAVLVAYGAFFLMQ